MKDNQKKYWKSIEELNNDPEFLKHAHEEFPSYLPLKEAHPSKSSEEGTGRRDFLKLMGFGVAAVSLAACEAPVKRAIPYLVKPEEVEPGIANWYASSYINGSDYCSILVKTREGRPIKIEGNALSGITKGGTNARAQASVLSIYDEKRLKNFVVKGKEVRVKDNNSEYASLDKEIISALKGVSNKGIRIVSRTIYSPTTLKVIEDFKAKFPTTEHIMYDAVSVYGMRQANKKSFGREIIPSYNFSNADVVVSFGADFLGTWISPIEYSKQYSVKRKVSETNKTMLRHYQIETNLSLTGANADYREAIKPSEEGLFLAALYTKITGQKLNVPAARESKILDMAADDLKGAKGKSLVVSASNDVNIQLLVNEINNALDSYGSTINISRACNFKKGNDAQALKFVDDVAAGKIGAIIFLDADPVYDLPNGAKLKSALKSVPVKISTSLKIDETSEFCEYLCPGLHFLEHWNDAEPYEEYYSMVQPAIAPIFRGNRALEESLLIWAGAEGDYYTYLRKNWQDNILQKGIGFDEAWDAIVQNGIYEPKAKGKDLSRRASGGRRVADSISGQTDVNLIPIEEPIDASIQQGNQNYTFSSNLASIATPIANYSKALSSGGMELAIYETIAMGDGSMANNSWLQELPDPITKATWGNYVTVSNADARNLKLKQGQIVSIKVGNQSLTAPIVVQPGQTKGTLGLAVGYGRSRAGISGENIGVNAFPIIATSLGNFSYALGKVTLTPTEGFYQIATTQTHDTVMERESIIQTSTLDEYKDPNWKKPFTPAVHTQGKEVPAGSPDTDFWYRHDYPNHLWSMMIDLNSCTGCGACVVSCIAENNIAIVGRQEVINRREMHWMRIDRYYSSDMTKAKAEEEGIGAVKMYREMEDPADNPEVVFQPMLC